MFLLLAIVLQVTPPVPKDKEQTAPVVVNQTTEPQIGNGAIAVVSALGGAIIGLITAIGTIWGKLRAQRYEYEAKIAELQKAKEERHMHREDEAYLELKDLLKERKVAGDDLSKRIDKLEAEHKLCEEKYDKVFAQTVEDKVEIGMLKAELRQLKGEPPKV